MLVSFSLLDDYTMVVSKEDPSGECWRTWETWGKLTPPGLHQVIMESFPSAPQLEDLQVASGAICDELPAEAVLQPDLEVLGKEADPGDRILPLEYITTGDLVQDLGLAEDVFDPDVRKDADLPSVDGRIYVYYGVVNQRNSANPYGSRHTFAGVPAVLTDRHPAAWEDSQLVSLPGFFWVVGVFPRRERNTFKNICTRDGRVVRVRMKDQPMVLVRWLDEDDLQPGVVDPLTGEREERYSILPAWALVDIATGESFKYDEAQARVVVSPRRQQFRKRVLSRLHPYLWQGGPVVPRKHLGVKWWKVELNPSAITVYLAYPNGKVATVMVDVKDGCPGSVSPAAFLLLFQLASWEGLLIEPQVEMLLSCHSIMRRRYPKDTAMAALIQWLAYTLSIPSPYDYTTPTMTLDMLDDLHSTFDIDLLKQEPWDWLGETALALGLDRWVPHRQSKEETISYVYEQLPDDLQPDDVIFDPSAGTGRVFFALQELGVDCIYTGSESFYRPYRILVVNKYLYDIPAYVVRSRGKLPFTSKLWWLSNNFVNTRVLVSKSHTTEQPAV